MSSSSDSDVGERMRNLRNVLVKSEASHKEVDKQFAFKRKLGDLIFNADFEGGNLSHVEQVDLFDYHLMVRPDVANPRSRLWFNFNVSNQLPNQCVIFTFVNLVDNLKIFDEGLTPVVRSRQNPNWVRLHRDQVFYYKSTDHDKRFVLSIAFKFSSHDNEHQFALYYPYSYTNLKDFITRWTVELKRIKLAQDSSNNLPRPSRRIPTINKQILNDDGTHGRSQSALSFNQEESDRQLQDLDDINLEVNQVGTTVLSKIVYQLTVRSLSNHRRKPEVIICCRPSGNLDSAASLVCQDPDSICAGNGRTDIFGQSNHTQKLLNLNQGVYANQIKIKQQVEKILARGSRVFLIEMRVNLVLIGSRIIGVSYEDECRMERHLALPRLIARFTRDFFLENCQFKTKFEEGFSIFPPNFLSKSTVDQYRLEVSPFAFYKRSLEERSYIEYNQRRYLSVGKAIILALLEILHPRGLGLPHTVRQELEAFDRGPGDVDDLILR